MFTLDFKIDTHIQIIFNVHRNGVQSSNNLYTMKINQYKSILIYDY